MSKTRKPGRPRGSKQPQVDVVITQPASTCKRCGSARRATYWHPRVHLANGIKTTWRRTRCLDCGQVRDDKTIESPRSAVSPSTTAATLEPMMATGQLGELIRRGELIPPPPHVKILAPLAKAAECAQTMDAASEPLGSPEMK